MMETIALPLWVIKTLVRSAFITGGSYGVSEEPCFDDLAEAADVYVSQISEIRAIESKEGE